MFMLLNKSLNFLSLGVNVILAIVSIVPKSGRIGKTDKLSEIWYNILR